MTNHTKKVSICAVGLLVFMIGLYAIQQFYLSFSEMERTIRYLGKREFQRHYPFGASGPPRPRMQSSMWEILDENGQWIAEPEKSIEPDLQLEKMPKPDSSHIPQANKAEVDFRKHRADLDFKQPTRTEPKK